MALQMAPLVTPLQPQTSSRGAVVALVADVADVAAGEGLAEHQLVADVAHLAAVADELEVPAAVGGVADHAGADQPVVLDDQLLVDAAVGVAHHDLLGARVFRAPGLRPHEVAGREEVDAGDLQLGADLAAGVAADAELRQVRGADLALLEQRRHQAVGDAAVCRALAHRIDARVGDGLHGVVDDDAARAVQPGGLGQCRVGADAGGHHHQVGRDLAAVLELHGGHAAGRAGPQRLRLCADEEADAAVFQRLLQQPAGHVVELALHQPRHDVHHGDLHAALHQPVGGLQAQQAAADHHRVPVDGGRIDHGLRVGDVAVAQHARQVGARHRQDEGVGAGGDEQPVVGRLGTVVGAHHAFHAVDLRHLAARVQCDAVVAVPVQRVEDDLVDRLLTGQHGAQQDAVVVGVRLGAEHGDVVEIRGDLQQFLERAHAGHAVADHHELHLLHLGSFRSTRRPRR